MTSHWNSKYAILCDLSVAQGREVPAEIRNTVAQDERPPRLMLTEETEEDFYSNYAGGGNCNAGPDLQLIQQMLQVVSGPSGDGLEETEVHTETVPKIIKKPNRNRNVAVNSLIEIYGQNEIIENGSPYSDSRVQESDSSSTEGVSNLVLTKGSKHRSYLPISANMFKKKSPSPKSSNSLFHAKSVTSERESDNRSPNKTLEPQMFVPSSRASEYYNKFVEKSKLQDKVREDIWSQAERKMKEIDARRNMSTISPSSSERSSDTHGMDSVRLTQHRHEISDKCVVCEVLCKCSNIGQRKTGHM